MSMPKYTVRDPYQLMNAANTVAVIVSWMAGHEIECTPLYDADAEWMICPHPPELWNWSLFEYRLKSS